MELIGQKIVQGLSLKQRNRRYSEARPKKSHAIGRINEGSTTKNSSTTKNDEASAQNRHKTPLYLSGLMVFL